MKNKGTKFDLLVLECPVSYMLWFEYIYIKCNNCFLFIRPWVPSDGNHNDKLTYAVLNKKILIKRPSVITRRDYMISRMKHRQIHMRKNDDMLRHLMHQLEDLGYLHGLTSYCKLHYIFAITVGYKNLVSVKL